ncbi:hypothetical protein P3S68_019902 [Capsicum galapagoense]
MSYKGGYRIPRRPMRNWAESKLTIELLKVVERAGYNNPSPIQMAAILLGLQQRDVIGVAETGSVSIEEQGSKIRQDCEVADRMIDMGLEPQVAGVLDAMPSSNMKPENREEELDEKKLY